MAEFLKEAPGIVAEALAPGNFERMLDKLRRGQDIDSLQVLTMLKNPSEATRQLLAAVLADPKVASLVRREGEMEQQNGIRAAKAAVREQRKAARR